MSRAALLGALLAAALVSASAAAEVPCPLNYLPVCGKDGVVYANDCLLKAAGTELRYACEGRKNCEADCEADADAVKPPTKPCTRESKPVCARDGQVYANACVAESEGQRVLFACDDRSEAQCKADCSAKPTPAQPAAACPKDYNPVCGTNGKTYSNECLARKEGKTRVRFSCKGRPDCAADCAAAKNRGCRCSAKPSKHATCARSGKVYSSECLLRCARATKRYSCKGKSKCADKCEKAAASCACPFIFAPACGKDGTVHSNACVARCLSRLRFECGDLTEKECARRCKRAARL